MSGVSTKDHNSGSGKRQKYLRKSAVLKQTGVQMIPKCLGSLQFQHNGTVQSFDRFC